MLLAASASKFFCSCVKLYFLVYELLISKAMR
jgi:hypothetical protein